MNKLRKAIGVGAALGLSVFVVYGVAFDIIRGGSLQFESWAYTKMACGAILVGLGFSVPSLVYDSRRLPYWAKVLIHMGVGCTVMLLAALLLGWIPLKAGALAIAIAVGGELLFAWIIFLCFSAYYRRLAKRMNDKLKASDTASQ